MATPTDVEGWVERLTELMEELEPKTVASAHSGNAQAKATVQAWAVEMQAAALFVATYTGAIRADLEVLIEVVNTVIDTVQAILLALGIAYILKKLSKKKGKKGVTEIVVTQTSARRALGDKVNPIPSRPNQDRVKEGAFLFLRLNWATHFMLTLMQALQIQSELDVGDDQELVWKAKLDANTCSICRTMDGEKSVDGDFLPVLLKKFPDYLIYVPWMGWPHAHPRCRCIAVPA